VPEAAPAVKDEAEGAATHDPGSTTDIATENHPKRSERTMTDGPKTTTRIAVPSELPGGLDADRAGHFGHAACFTLVDITPAGEVGEIEVLQNAPHVEGGCMTPVVFLAENNVDAIVVQGIGGRPLMGFNQVGIAVLQGVGAQVSDSVDALLSGGLPQFTAENACGHHH
jgi:predicted Fe-Mo cluster-binding NifX family protein